MVIQTLDDFVPIKKEITKRRNRALTKQGYVSLAVRVLILGLVVWLLLTQVFLVTQASGNGMFPAIKDGDLIIGFRLESDYSKDDVVVYEIGDETYIGRVVARESDVVTIDENGTLYVNGTVQSGEILYPTYQKDGITDYPYTVPEGCFFILGDYRTQSNDSRDFGAVNEESIQGKIITILRRRGI